MLPDAGHDRCDSEPWSNTINFDFDFLSNLCTLNENHETVDFGDAVPAVQKFDDFCIVLLTYFYWFRTV